MQSKTRIRITGTVQGVGFRPFLYNLASKYKLKGFCLNDSRGILIEVQGEMIDTFIQEIKASPPPLSKIEELTSQVLVSKEIFKNFSIRQSIPLPYQDNFTLISPDIATCQDCLRELFDPGDRRYLYPFINCTNCGPRYSIIKDIPYDRSTTTMNSFIMCEECENEYHNPASRRFHAQPNACPRCGPRVWLAESGKKSGIRNSAINYSAIQSTQELLREGAIIAIKGLGGFHLACDATNDDAVKKLRERKRRSNKPFALMAPDIETTEGFCSLSEEEKTILRGRIRPIVILEKIPINPISRYVAFDNRNLGVMLPYTPLHHLLFSPKGTKFTALVMTSGNQSEEPIVTSNDEAIERLSPITNFFLLHDRDIYMRVDDSIVRSMRSKAISDAGLEIMHSTSKTQDLKSEIRNPKSGFQVIRRARGFTPEPIDLEEEMGEILACGAELKNTFCLTKGKKAILSQHIGDLQNYNTLEFFRESLKNIKNSFRINPEVIAHDLHPDYMSTGFALDYAAQLNITDARIIPVQHHHAHIVSCMAEHNLSKEVIGIAFDGTGYGPDSNVWGGEFFIAGKGGFVRKAHLQYIPMPGADKAVREPWRMAIAYLYQVFGDKVTEALPSFFKRFSLKDIEVIISMIKKTINSPSTSSAGRLFDAVSSLLGIIDITTFEGEAAMELEKIADSSGKKDHRSYPFQIISENPLVINLKPLIQSIVEDFRNGVEISIVSYNFHDTLARVILEISKILEKQCGIKDVVMSGGVFQNKLLLNMAVEQLEKEGLRAWYHAKIPAHDGGISLGQAVVAWEKVKGMKDITMEIEKPFKRFK